MQACILCTNKIRQKTKPEHVLLNALGGRMTVRDVLCSECNNKMGIGPDQDLANSVLAIRNLGNLKSGNGRDAPPIHGLESDGVRFDLGPGMVPVYKPLDPLKIEFDEEGVFVQLKANSHSQANTLLEGAARKIAKTYNLQQSEPIIEAIKTDLARDGVITTGPGPRVFQSLEFGGGMSQRAMAKSALVLWASRVGNEEVQTPKYDTIREFILKGTKPYCPERLVKVDSRPLPKLPEKFGANANLIWVGSNDSGCVYGYFRLYGAIGWRILLCDAGPRNVIRCLISNPVRTSKWATFNDEMSPIIYEWVGEEWRTELIDENAVTERLNLLVNYFQKNSQEKMVENIVKDAIEEAGIQYGDILTSEALSKISNYIAKRLAAYVTKTSFTEALRSR